MSYTQRAHDSSLGFLTPQLVTGLIAKGIDAAAGGPKQRRRARAAAARTADLRRQTAEAQAAAQTASDAAQSAAGQESARRVAEMQARAAEEESKARKKLIVQLSAGAAIFVAAGITAWLVWPKKTEGDKDVQG